ncbi:hypothetical protein EC968_005185 [Mortierella alpina]|nr:hypothetical protein EC968_005185 [Mortierella alpina]
MRIPRPASSWSEKALGIPEIVQLIQEQLCRPSLLISLRVARLWYHAGHCLVWRAVDWDNTLEGSFKELAMLQNIHRIRVLQCMFHSQAGTVSSVDSSSFLRSIVVGEDLAQKMTLNAGAHATEDVELATSCTTMTALSALSAQDDNLKTQLSIRTSLQRLQLKGHFDLTSSLNSKISLQYIPFNIPTLTHLDIRPSVSSAVDIHLILDSASSLQYLFIQSHGSFVDSSDSGQRDAEGYTMTDAAVETSTSHSLERPLHRSLLSLKIQHLKMSLEELEGVAARCPNLVEFQSLCSPGTLWKQRPSQQQQDTSVDHEPQEDRKSLVRKLAASCPNIERFHVGLQQGGFHLDSIKETLTSFPRLEALGLPAWDCTKVTMETLKSIQIHQPLSSSGTFLTILCIMNVCSSERISQSIHDYLCWTPYLKEFYAYNTTLYVEQMQAQQTQLDSLPGGDHAVLQSALEQKLVMMSTNGFRESVMSQDTADSLQTTAGASTHLQHLREAGSSPIPVESTPIHTERPHSPAVTLTQRPAQWACTRLERLVVRFARLPWRNLSDPPKRSRDTFEFLRPLQNLRHLCIKEGLMLETGREYEALQRLGKLEEVVFATCYPIPIKPADMAAWMTAPAEQAMKSGSKSGRTLKRVVVRRQKANAVADKEMMEWFREHQPDVRFAFETTDCCEEEYGLH